MALAAAARAARRCSRALRGRRVCALASGDPMYYGMGATLARVLGPVRGAARTRRRCRWRAPGWGGRRSPSRWSARSGGRSPRCAGCSRRGPACWCSARARTRRARSPRCSPTTGGATRPSPSSSSSAARANVASTAPRGDWVHPPGDPLNLVAVPATDRAEPSPRACPDDAFDHDGQLTKREVRAVTLALLGPRRGELLWDVGAGNGSIALEWLRAHPTCRAVAVEPDPARAARIAANADALGVPGVRVVEGRAPDALDGLPDAGRGLHRRRRHRRRRAAAVLGGAARRWAAGRQRRHRRVGRGARARRGPGSAAS